VDDFAVFADDRQRPGSGACGRGPRAHASHAEPLLAGRR
jgi:hypothetical protein